MRSQPKLLRACRVIAVLACAVILCPSAAHAQATWTSATSGTWGTAANWSTGIVPGVSNTTAAVLTNTAASYTVTYDTAMTGTLAGFVLKNTVGGTTTLNINAPGFAIAGSGTTPGAGAEMAYATINVNTGGVFTNTGRLGASGSNSSVIVNGGMLVNTSDFGYAVGLLDTIKINLTLSSGTVNSTGSGFFFPTLTMTGGVVNVSGSSQPGINGGTISGGTFTNTSINPLLSRTGLLTITGAAQVTTSGVQNPGNSNNFAISGGTVLITGTQFHVGNNNFPNTRTADITQSGGSVAMANAAGLVVGFASGSLSASSDYSYRLSGGTLSLEKITLAAAGYIGSGTNRFTMTGGTLDLGSGGIVFGSGSGTKLVQLAGGTIGAKGGGWTSSVGMSLLTGTGSGTATFRAADTNGTANNITLSGILSGSGALAKTGAGVLSLQNANTFSGTTTVLGGQLQIDSAGSINGTSGIRVNGSGAEFKYNSATALTKPLTLTQGTLSGTGTINTPVSIGTNVTLSPGNSPGTQTYQSDTFASGGTYAWEINNWASGTAGVNFDQAIFTNGLAITSSSASPFTVNLVSLKADNTSGAVPGFNSGLTGLSFAIATGTMTGYSPNVFALGTSSFLTANTVSGSANGGFWLSTNSGSSQLVLNYAPSARYTLSATPAATAIRTGSSTVITGAITSSTADRTGADAMAFSSLSVGTGSLSTTSGTLLSGSSASGIVTYTGTAAGQFTFAPSVSAINVNLGSNAVAGTVTSGTVTVWNPAMATTSGSVNLGTVIVGASSLSQALSVTNSAPAGGFSESLNASFGALSGVTTNSGSISLLAAGATNASAMTVGLATGSVGNLSGSAQINFQTDGQGTSGLTAAALEPQTVNIYGTVLDHATPAFLGVLNPLTTSTLALNFGSMDETAGLQSLTFSLTNLAALAGANLTAGLALTGTGTEVGSGFSLAGATFSNLLAGGTSGLFTVSFTPSGQGSFSQTFKLSFSDNQSLAGATARRDLFVAANVIVVPEPTALALAGIGVAAAAWACRRRK